MASLASRITDELQLLVGLPLADCWRATNMQIFGFGPLERYKNRNGEEVEGCKTKLHVQCRWRFVDAEKILFARDDLNYPADESIDPLEFDWDTQDSILDVKQRAWFAEHRLHFPRVVDVSGDRYGGFRIRLERGLALECIPCNSRHASSSEHWRLIGHRPYHHHFVVTDDGIQGDSLELPSDG